MTTVEQRFYEAVPRRLQAIEDCLERMTNGIDKLIRILSKEEEDE